MRDKTTQSHSDNKTDKEQRQSEFGFSYALFLILLTLFIVAVTITLSYISFSSGWIDKKESPTPIQFFIVNLFSLLVLGAIIFQAFVYWKQWKAMRDALTHSKEAVTATERAYLTVDRIFLKHNKFVAGVVPRVEIVLKNGGKTPAFNVRASVRITVSEKTMIADVKQGADKSPEPDKIGDRVLPGEIVSPFIPQQNPISANIIGELQGNERRFYVLIDCLYFDFEGSEQPDFFDHGFHG